MVANAMPLVPKITEIVERNNISLAFVAETWLKSAVEDTVLDVPGFSIVRRHRTSNTRGGVCFYIKDDYFRFKKFDELSCCKDHEILWVHLRPMITYFSLCRWLNRDAVIALSSRVAGDFNRLDIKSLKKHFRLKQIVKKPTGKNAILHDLVITNLLQYYDESRLFSPFGLSDHKTFTAEARVRESGQKKYKIQAKARCLRKS